MKTDLPIGRLIFSRRTTQNLLTELDQVLSPQQRAELANRLNRRHRDRFSALWETVIIAACSKVAPVIHEQALTNGRKPDVALSYAADGALIRVVADVATASDRGLHERNPFRLYWDELERRAKRHGLSWRYFRFDVRGSHTAKGPIVLSLPSRKLLTGVMKDSVEPFLRTIKRNPSQRSALQMRAAGVDCDITYDPQTRYPGASHTAFNQAHSLTRNPVFSAIENKIDQLRGVDDGVLRGIVLCDAGCACMKPLMNPGGALSLRDIVNAFLRSTASIDFVVTVAIEKISPWSGKSALRLNVVLQVSDRPERRHVASEEALRALWKLVSDVAAVLPKPIQDAENAYLQCERPGFSLGHHGGYRLDGPRIRMSSRQLVEILANGWQPLAPNGDAIRSDDFQLAGAFASMMARGLMIKHIEVVRDDDGDDDWLDITFAGPDPAISAYR